MTGCCLFRIKFRLGKTKNIFNPNAGVNYESNLVLLNLFWLQLIPVGSSFHKTSIETSQTIYTVPLYAPNSHFLSTKCV